MITRQVGKLRLFIAKKFPNFYLGAQAQNRQRILSVLYAFSAWNAFGVGIYCLMKSQSGEQEKIITDLKAKPDIEVVTMNTRSKEASA